MTTNLVSDTVVIEREANYFALCLLIPEDMLRLEARKLGGVDIEDGIAIGKLARLFKVSDTLMAVRIGTLIR